MRGCLAARDPLGVADVKPHAWFEIRTLDDAGKAVRLLDPATTKELSSAHHPRFSNLRTRMWAACGRTSLLENVLFFGGFAATLVVLFGGASIYQRLLPGSFPWPVFFLTLVPVFCGGLLGRRSMMKRKADAIATVMLAEGLCPSCAYCLSETPIALTGICICPECGARWRDERVRRSSSPLSQTTVRLSRGLARTEEW